MTETITDMSSWLWCRAYRSVCNTLWRTWANLKHVYACVCNMFVRILNCVNNLRGNYLFSPWTTKKCTMPPWTTNSTKIEHSITKDNPFLSFRQSKGLKQTVNGSRDCHTPFYLHFLPLFPHELPQSSNMPLCKTAHDPLTVFFNPSNWRKGEKWLSLVVECSILVELVVHGGHRAFFGSLRGKR
jgi:hypothetical protein